MKIFELIKSIFNIGKLDLSNIIENQINSGLLFEHRITFMDILDYKLNFYKTDISRKNYWVNLLSSNDIPYEVKVGYKSIIMIGEDRIITILFEWIGLYDFVNVFERFKDQNLKRKLFLVKCEIKKCLNHLSEQFSSVLSHFDNIAVDKDKIEFHKSIIPDKAYIGNILVNIPEEDRTEINKIEIFVDSSGLITSVRLNGLHPNADNNGWYCLGSLKFSPLTVDNIYKLIENIKCFHLSDCYWKPENYKKWVKDSQGK
jgi:hypothetical protein